MASGTMLARTFSRAGYHVLATNEYPSLIRGGNNIVTVRIATTKFEAMNRDVHILVALNRETIDLHKDELSEMPQWLRPTGYFGIGLQSVFNITNEFFIFTKSKDEELKGISLRNPKMNLNLFVESIYEKEVISYLSDKEEVDKNIAEKFLAEY